MPKRDYFPAIDVHMTGRRFEAVCGLKMVALLKASLMANDHQAVHSEPWQNPVHPVGLHDSRVAFLKAVSEWPEDTTLELHISARPDLGHMPKGKVFVTIGVRCFSDTKAGASEAIISRFLQLKALLPAHFPEAEFSPIRDADALRARLHPFVPTHAVALTRRREAISLAKAFETRATGFGVPLHTQNTDDHEAMHIFPWVPSYSDWRTLIDILLWQIDPMWVLIRIRSGAITESQQTRLSETIETCEAYLTKTRVCKTVLTQKVEKLRDLSLERLVEMHARALWVGVFMLARHRIDSAAASVLGQSITEGYNRNDKRGLLRGGFVSKPITVDKALDCGFFPEEEPFTAQEAACAFRLPAPPTGRLSGLPVKHTRTAFISLPVDYMRQNGITLGTNQHRGMEQPVTICPRDRMRHFFIMGQTGTGKSTLMETMALQDIRAGRGVCLIDPHGELLESLLGKIPEERADDVIVFDPLDREQPVGLNLIEWKTIEERDFIIDELYLTLDRTYNMRETGGPIFESNFRGMLKLLMGDKKRDSFVPTLLEFPILYISD